MDKTPALENDPTYVNTHHNLWRERRLKFLLGVMTLLGTCVTAYATYEAAIIGANSPTASNQPFSFSNNVYIGTQIVNQTIRQGHLKFEGSPAVRSIVVPVPAQQPPTEHGTSSSEKLRRNTEPSCSGLDTSVWDISLGPVHKLAVSGGNGYSVLLHLRNKSDLSQLIALQDKPSLTDDLGNSSPVSSPTIPRKTFGFTGTKVSPGAEASAEFQSEKVPELGRVIESLNLPLSIQSSDGLGHQKENASYGLTCSNLPLDASSSSSASNP